MRVALPQVFGQSAESEAYARQPWISGRSVHQRGSRLEREEVPDIETFLRICDWLRMAPGEFIQIDETKSMNTLELIEQELRADGVLRSEVIDAFITVAKAVYPSHPS
jgi:hypothetical protein